MKNKRGLLFSSTLENFKKVILFLVLAGTPKIRHRVHSRGILKEKLCQEDTHRLLPSKKELARELGISRQSLYYQPKLPAKDLKLKDEIEKVMSDNKAYGLNALEYYPAPQISHSDQGSEYRRETYLNLLKSFNIQPSMSEKASP